MTETWEHGTGTFLEIVRGKVYVDAYNYAGCENNNIIILLNTIDDIIDLFIKNNINNKNKIHNDSFKITFKGLGKIIRYNNHVSQNNQN